MNLPREYISYSQIRLYQTCPKKYYYSYIENISTQINDKVFLGVVFHSVIEHYFKEKILGNDTNIETLAEIFTQKFDTLRKEQPVKWDCSVEETRKRGIAFVRYFVRNVAVNISPLMAEKELWVELPDSGIKLKGVLDLVETDLSITDFKTSTAKWSKSRIKSSYLQVVIYRYLFEQNFGKIIPQLKLRVLFGKNSTHIKHQELIVKPQDVDFNYSQMFEIINHVIESIQKGLFEKRDNFTCNFCEYKELCKNSAPVGIICPDVHHTPETGDSDIPIEERQSMDPADTSSMSKTA